MQIMKPLIMQFSLACWYFVCYWSKYSPYFSVLNNPFSK